MLVYTVGIRTSTKTRGSRERTWGALETVAVYDDCAKAGKQMRLLCKALEEKGEEAEVLVYVWDTKTQRSWLGEQDRSFTYEEAAP